MATLTFTQLLGSVLVYVDVLYRTWTGVLCALTTSILAHISSRLNLTWTGVMCVLTSDTLASHQFQAVLDPDPCHVCSHQQHPSPHQFLVVPDLERCHVCSHQQHPSPHQFLVVPDLDRCHVFSPATPWPHISSRLYLTWTGVMCVLTSNIPAHISSLLYLTWTGVMCSHQQHPGLTSVPGCTWPGPASCVFSPATSRPTSVPCCTWPGPVSCVLTSNTLASHQFQAVLDLDRCHVCSHQQHPSPTSVSGWLSSLPQSVSHRARLHFARSTRNMSRVLVNSPYCHKVAVSDHPWLSLTRCSHLVSQQADGLHHRAVLGGSNAHFFWSCNQ